MSKKKDLVLFKYGKKCYYLKNSGFIDKSEDDLTPKETEQELKEIKLHENHRW